MRSVVIVIVIVVGCIVLLLIIADLLNLLDEFLVAGAVGGIIGGIAALIDCLPIKWKKFLNKCGFNVDLPDDQKENKK